MPDISAAANILSRRNETPSEKDWNGAKRTIRYLNTTKNLNLVIDAKYKPVLEAYADADWVRDTKTRKSTSGNLFLFGRSPIQCTTKRQSRLALSSAEVEYSRPPTQHKNYIWLTKLLEDLNLPQKLPVTYTKTISAVSKW